MRRSFRTFGTEDDAIFEENIPEEENSEDEEMDVEKDTEEDD